MKLLISTFCGVTAVIASILLLVAPGVTTTAAAAAAADPPIEHFVAIMLENRAFDSMLGLMAKQDSRITGIKDFKSINNSFRGTTYYANDTIPYVNPFDPHHGFDDTTMEMFSVADPKTQHPPMSGFVKEAIISNQHPPENVLNAFPPHRVPAITTLAKEFALFNKYFASFPGETVINRCFFHKGDSDRKVSGSIWETVAGYNGTTIYDFFSEQGISWKAYFEDVSDLWYTNNMRKLDVIVDHFRFFDEFKKDAAAGTLPKFSWISPAFFPFLGKPARDQHPRHDVRDGEDIMAETYHAVRAGPGWNKTALLVFYDEHGGFADQVPPPANAPPMPPSLDSAKPFNWTRIGVRIPAILISPWVGKNHVEQEPQGTSASYEHTSIWNTLRNLWAPGKNTKSRQLWKPLSARQAWAAPYDHLLRNRTTPRTDCPTSVPTPPRSKDEIAAEALRQRAMAPGDLQKEFFAMVEGMAGRDGSNIADFRSVGEMGDHVRAEVRKILDRAAKQKKPLSGLKN